VQKIQIPVSSVSARQMQFLINEGFVLEKPNPIEARALQAAQKRIQRARAQLPGAKALEGESAARLAEEAAEAFRLSELRGEAELLGSGDRHD
jgi:hypothetical protein